jgi:hypothetical protein
MPWTRVRDKVTGHHYTVATVNPEKHVVLKQDALDANGRPRRMKPRAEVARSSQATDKQPAAPTEKEKDQ